MAVVRGMDFKLYRNTATPTTPTWVLMTNVRDLTRNRDTALADVSTRGSQYRLQVPTLKDLSIDFQLVYFDDDADQEAFEEAYEAGDSIDMAFLDGPISTVGSKGLRMMGQVSNFTTNEALEDAGLIDITVVPANDPDNLPRRVEVAVAGTIEDV